MLFGSHRVSGHFWAVLLKSGTEMLRTLKGWSSDPILVLYKVQWPDTLLTSNILACHYLDPSNVIFID